MIGDLHLDLISLSGRIRQAFDSLYSGPPDFDCSDPLDGDNLARFSGRSYDDIQEVLVEEDLLPFLALVPDEVARYYMGGYMLFFLERIGRCRDLHPLGDVPFIPGIAYITMMGFLKQASTREWLSGSEGMAEIVTDFLSAFINTAGFDFDEEEKEEIRSILGKLRNGGAEGAP